MILQGDCREVLKTLDAESVHCCVTSPPYYGLRDYGIDGQLGLESTPEAYTANLVNIFSEVRRVLRADGTLWLNLGDTYFGSGRDGNPPDSPHQKQRTNRGTVAMPISTTSHQILKPKDLIGIPWRVAFALQADGWYLRQDIIWHKPNPMPESVTDRCTKAHECIFLLSKSAKYFFNADAIKEPTVTKDSTIRDRDTTKCNNTPGRKRQGKLTENNYDFRNKRSVWSVSPSPFKGAHFATFPPELIRPCIRAGCPKGGTVLDPFNGAGTTGVVAKQEGCEYIGIELNPQFVKMSEKRLQEVLI